jgi:hypothetical protein
MGNHPLLLLGLGKRGVGAQGVIADIHFIFLHER